MRISRLSLSCPRSRSEDHLSNWRLCLWSQVSR